MHTAGPDRQVFRRTPQAALNPLVTFFVAQGVFDLASILWIHSSGAARVVGGLLHHWLWPVPPLVLVLCLLWTPGPTALLPRPDGLHVKYGLLRRRRYLWTDMREVAISLDHASLATQHEICTIPSSIVGWCAVARAVAAGSGLVAADQHAVPRASPEAVAELVRPGIGIGCRCRLAAWWSPVLLLALVPWLGFEWSAAWLTGTPPWVPAISTALGLVTAASLVTVATWHRDLAVAPEGLAVRSGRGAAKLGWAELHAVQRVRRGWLVQTCVCPFLIGDTQTGRQVVTTIERVLLASGGTLGHHTRFVASGRTREDGT